MKITLASHNEGKLQEFRELLPHYTLESLAALGLPLPEETGQTYEENAVLKARAVHREVGGYVLADDSGLSIDALDGAPGLYSARFAGAEADYDGKIEAIWHLLGDTDPAEWTASFICALAFIRPDGEVLTFRGQTDGLILPEKRGGNGFGFDPIFFLPQRGLTTAEMTPAEKNAISHRGRAVAKLIAYLNAHAGGSSDA